MCTTKTRIFEKWNDIREVALAATSAPSLIRAPWGGNKSGVQHDKQLGTWPGTTCGLLKAEFSKTAFAAFCPALDRRTWHCPVSSKESQDEQNWAGRGGVHCDPSPLEAEAGGVPEFKANLGHIVSSSPA